MEDLLGQLGHEKSAKKRAATDAANQRRLARALARLASAVISSDSLYAPLQQLLEIFVEVSGVDIATIYLREKDRLQRYASHGFDADPTLPFDEQLAELVVTSADAMLIAPPASDAIYICESLRKKSLQALWIWPMVDDGAFIGLLHVGTIENRKFSEENKQLLSVLVARIKDAITHYRSQETLRKAIRSRDEALSVVAHDLKNPLNVIAIAASTLLKRITDSSHRRPIERIMRGVHRADRLIRDLLEIDALETGRFILDRRGVEPADLILSALELQQSLAADASVIIAPDLSPELPPIEADEERLLEVLENLIGNAIKFTEPGGTITVGAAREENEILLWVKDSGAGIPPEQLPYIYDRFWQAKKEERRGTGLGLTICKGIVEAHGGEIWAESTVGIGTTMFFTIPARSARTGDPDMLEVANILLVDDRPENLISLEAILERPDYRLVTASSGEEALSLTLREHFAVALIDIAMPGMNGLEVALHMKELERSRDVPIIFVTAFGEDPEEIHRAYSAGGADYLVKPLDTDIVRKKVAVFVDLNRKRRGTTR